MIRIAAIFTFMLFLASTAFAVSTGPIVSDRWGNVSVAIEYNEVLNRDIDSRQEKYSGYEITESDSVYGVFAYKFYDNKDIKANVYVKIGATDFETQGTNLSLNRTERHKFDTSLLWGIGANVVYPFTKGTQLVLDGQFVSWAPNLEEIMLSDVPSSSESGNIEASIYELQGAVLLRTVFELGEEENAYALAPYAGLVISYMDIDMGDTTYNVSTQSGGLVTNLSAKSEDIFGIALGTEIFLPMDFRLKFDGRLITEEAITLSGILEF